MSGGASPWKSRCHAWCYLWMVHNAWWMISLVSRDKNNCFWQNKSNSMPMNVKKIPFQLWCPFPPALALYGAFVFLWPCVFVVLVHLVQSPWAQLGAVLPVLRRLHVANLYVGTHFWCQYICCERTVSVALSPVRDFTKTSACFCANNTCTTTSLLQALPRLSTFGSFENYTPLIND